MSEMENSNQNLNQQVKPNVFFTAPVSFFVLNTGQDKGFNMIEKIKKQSRNNNYYYYIMKENTKDFSIYTVAPDRSVHDHYFKYNEDNNVHNFRLAVRKDVNFNIYKYSYDNPDKQEPEKYILQLSKETAEKKSIDVLNFMLMPMTKNPNTVPGYALILNLDCVDYFYNYNFGDARHKNIALIKRETVKYNDSTVRSFIYSLMLVRIPNIILIRSEQYGYITDKLYYVNPEQLELITKIEYPNSNVYKIKNIYNAIQELPDLKQYLDKTMEKYRNNLDNMIEKIVNEELFQHDINYEDEEDNYNEILNEIWNKVAGNGQNNNNDNC